MLDKDDVAVSHAKTQIIFDAAEHGILQRCDLNIHGMSGLARQRIIELR